MSFIDVNVVEEQTVPPPFHRRLSIILAPDLDDTVKGFTFLISTLEPVDGKTPMHDHGNVGELMYFISGKGKAILEDGTEYMIKPNTVLWAPPGVKHQTVNLSDEPLRIACVFIPAVNADYIQKSIQDSMKATQQK